MSTTPQRRLVRAAIAAGALATGMSAMADTQFVLSDHPDGNAALPTYGLRQDNIFASLGGAGLTTFSFDVHNDVVMTVTESGGDLKINIAGTIYGGVDTGMSYGFGEGSYDLDFTFNFNVMEMGTGYVVSPSNVGNSGVITSLGNADVALGTEFEFFDFSGNSFLFKQDEHRLGGEDEAGQGFWIGRGWTTFESDGRGSSGTQDWLFLGRIIPTPTAIGFGMASMIGLCATRRRRLA